MKHRYKVKKFPNSLASVVAEHNRSICGKQKFHQIKWTLTSNKHSTISRRKNSCGILGERTFIGKARSANRMWKRRGTQKKKTKKRQKEGGNNEKSRQWPAITLIYFDFQRRWLLLSAKLKIWPSPALCRTSFDRRALISPEIRETALVRGPALSFPPSYAKKASWVTRLSMKSRNRL